jgi:hypothetical protein
MNSKLSGATQRVPGEERVGCVGRTTASIAGSACLLMLTVGSTAFAQSPFSYDDIRFWVGSGANRAALVIDWDTNSTEPPALAWGYRWNGMARGAEMLRAIVAADSRLFAKLGGTPSNPDAVYGIGYDANRDGKFSIDDGTQFDEAGIAFAADPSDGATSVDFHDVYAEGWYAGFWHYGVGSATPFDGGAWDDSREGIASRVLFDGAWDSLAFESPITFTGYAQNARSAAPPFMPGDFNQDGRMNAADYDVWRGAFGSHSSLTADGNGNGTIDAPDYVVWRKQFTTQSPSSNVPTLAVPEASTIALTLCSLCIFWQARRLNRQEKFE